MYYKICQNCGAHLDPGEKCDCEKEAAANAANIDSGKTGNSFPTHISVSKVSQEGAGCQ